MGDATPQPSKILFVTGKLAEPALRRLLDDLAPKLHFTAEIAVMPISVAALLTTEWIGRRFTVPPNVDRVVLPGFCRGDASAIPHPEGVAIDWGPKDLRDLPEFLGSKAPRTQDDLTRGRYDIEILAEINHAPQLPMDDLLREARRYRDAGADWIDLGCDPASTWHGIADAVRRLRDEGMRVSVDSFNADEVEIALAAGATRVLSVNGTNVHFAKSWNERFGPVEVVAIPDTPSDLASFERTVETLEHDGVCYLLDPIVEPIGFGFAASLGRYLEVRKRFPNAAMMMGVGNLTELTDVDSAGINVLLAGFCQEVGIHAVLTTEVIPWCRSAVREFDLARRLVAFAVKEQVPPKKRMNELVMLRDPKRSDYGEAALRELAAAVTDRNYRIFAERGKLFILNGSTFLEGTDPFSIFEELMKIDARIDASHAFYLGYEFAKAVTALTLGKQYQQDQALRWGFLTIPEVSHREERK